ALTRARALSFSFSPSSAELGALLRPPSSSSTSSFASCLELRLFKLVVLHFFFSASLGFFFSSSIRFDLLPCSGKLLSLVGSFSGRRLPRREARCTPRHQ
ncbi:hypothetical protein PIB30_053757, partial [Stylosanthes scabra]|nr:hypothetical protein [Stylosanthes scabra]